MVLFKCSALCFAVLLPLTAAAQEIGWIESLDGPAGAAQLLRAGQPVALKLFGAVHEGDQVRASGAAAVTIALGEGKLLRVDARNSPQLLKKAGKPPTLPGNLLKWMSGMLDEKMGHADSVKLASMSVRADPSAQPLSMPYLERAFALAGGARSLYFSWRGGQGPFQVKLTRKGENLPFYQAAGLDAMSHWTPVLQLAPGLYQLEVSGADQGASSDWLQVVAPGSVPPAPPHPPQVSPATGALIDALYLVGVEQGRWIVEAMQQLAQLAKTHAAAQAYLDRVQRGFDGVAPAVTE